MGPIRDAEFLVILSKDFGLVSSGTHISKFVCLDQIGLEDFSTLVSVFNLIRGLCTFHNFF